jgi:hypothetical protein
MNLREEPLEASILDVVGKTIACVEVLFIEIRF